MPRLLQAMLFPLLLTGCLLLAPAQTLVNAEMNEASNSSESPESVPESVPELEPEPQTLEQLPAGQYYYSSPQSSSKRPSFVLLRKSGRTVIGWDHRGGPACFRGFASGNQIINATRILAPYQPDSELLQGETLDLTGYRVTDHAVTQAEAETLRTCVGMFWR